MSITYDSATNTITVTGFSETSPCTFEDIYQADLTNGWNVVSKQGDNQYYFQAKLQIGDGTTQTWFKDSGKQITFAKGLVSANLLPIIDIKNGATFQLGDLVDESKKETRNGCHFKLLETTYSTNFFQIRNGGVVYIYSSSIAGSGRTAYLRSDSPSTTSRLWNIIFTDDAIVLGGKFDIFNLTSIRANTGLNNVYDTLNDIGIYFATWHGIRYGAIGRSVTMKNVNLYYCVNDVYGIEISDNHYLVDATSTNEPWKFIWYSSDPPSMSQYKIYRQYTFNPIITDKEGNPISGAHVILKDKDENIIIDALTDSNGRILNGTEPYVITYATYNIDPSAPANTITPATIETIYSPHHLIISKEGYATYQAKITIDHPIIDDVFVLDALTYTYDDIMNELEKIENLIKKHDSKMTALKFI